MAVIRFNVADEFLAELEVDKDFIERKIVRVTALFRPAKRLPFRRVYLLSTAKLLNGDILWLEKFLGPHWEIQSEDNDRTREIYERELTSLKERLHDLGFEVRAGYYAEGGVEE